MALSVFSLAVVLASQINGSVAGAARAGSFFRSSLPMQSGRGPAPAPLLAEAKRKAGIEFYYKGEEAKARAAFEEAIKMGDARSMTWMGLIERRPRDCKPRYEVAFHWFKKAADARDSVGSYWLSLSFVTGEGTVKDPEKADQMKKRVFADLRRDANNGDTHAMVELGEGYTNSESKSDQTFGYECFEKAAEAGDIYGMERLGWAHYMGVGTSANVKKALEWFQKAAERGHPAAQSWMGNIYLTGRDFPADYGVALKWNRIAAASGDFDGVLQLAHQLKYGLGVPEDLVESYRLYKLAADADQVKGVVNVAHMTEVGAGCKADHQEALRYYRKGAQLGSGECMFWVAEFLLRDEEGEKYLGQAFALLLRASELEYEKAFFRVGYMYEHGIYVDENLESAYLWYKRGAELDEPCAITLLGELYLHGKGVGESKEEAVRLFKKAALMNEPTAMLNYGVCLYRGIGVDKNEKEGISWVKKAANSDLDEAKEFLKTIGADGSR